MSQWSVLLADSAGVDPMVMAKWMAAQKGIPLFDAQRAARHAWGFLAEKVTEAEARSLQESAEQAGFGTRLIPTDAIPIPSDPVPIHGIGFSADAFQLMIGVPPAPRPPTPWSALRVLSFVRIRRDTVVTKTVTEQVSGGRRLAGLGIMLATGIPVGMGKAKEIQKTSTVTDWLVFLDIFADGGRWRVVPERFDFSGLGAEKTFAGPENLRRLLSILRKSAPDALLNRGARGLLEGTALGALGYDDLDDAEKENRWLLALSQPLP